MLKWTNSPDWHERISERVDIGPNDHCPCCDGEMGEKVSRLAGKALTTLFCRQCAVVGFVGEDEVWSQPIAVVDLQEKMAIVCAAEAGYQALEEVVCEYLEYVQSGEANCDKLYEYEMPIFGRAVDYVAGPDIWDDLKPYLDKL